MSAAKVGVACRNGGKSGKCNAHGECCVLGPQLAEAEDDALDADGKSEMEKDNEEKDTQDDAESGVVFAQEGATCDKKIICQPMSAAKVGVACRNGGKSG